MALLTIKNTWFKTAFSYIKVGGKLDFSKADLSNDQFRKKLIEDLADDVAWCDEKKSLIDKNKAAKKAADKLNQIYNNLSDSKIDVAKNDIKNLYNDKDVQGYLANDVKEFLEALCTNK